MFVEVENRGRVLIEVGHSLEHQVVFENKEDWRVEVGHKQG